MLILQDHDVRRLLPMGECIQAMETAFGDLGGGRALNVPRIRYKSPSANPDIVYTSNVHIGTTPSMNMGAVRIGGSSRNVAAPKQGVREPLHGNMNWGFICLINLETGQPVALVQEFALSGIRVGATNGLAAKHLAREGASSLGLFGSGKLARTTLEALALVRSLKRVKVFSPTPEHRRDFAKEMSALLEIEVTAVEAAEEVVADADIVCCATNAAYLGDATVYDGDWLTRGQLVISIQNSDVNFLKTEVDETTFVRSGFICINDRESVTSNNQRELLDLIDQGRVSWDKVHELGDVVLGKARPANLEEEIVYYKNNSGLGIQMAAAGAVLYRQALAQGVGHQIPDEWFGTDLTDWYGKGLFPSA